MKASGTCPKCGSKDIIPRVTVENAVRGEESGLVTYQDPDALIFKGRQKSDLLAWVCGACGYLELYAGQPQQLKLKPKSGWQYPPENP